MKPIEKDTLLIHAKERGEEDLRRKRGRSQFGDSPDYREFRFQSLVI